MMVGRVSKPDSRKSKMDGPGDQSYENVQLQSKQGAMLQSKQGAMQIHSLARSMTSRLISNLLETCHD
jgi:hypothetical protein